MAKKVPVDQLSAAIDKVLAEYGVEVKEILGEIVKVMAKKGAKAVQQNSSATFGGTGAYAKGWTTRMETGRYSSQGIIYNAAEPGLPHLLEHGHAIVRSGKMIGRVSARPHIAPAEQNAAKELERRITLKVSGGTK